MFSINQNVWVTRRESPAEGRDRAHRIAIHEARLATDDGDTGAAIARRRAPSRGIALVPAASSGGVDLTARCA